MDARDRTEQPAVHPERQVRGLPPLEHGDLASLTADGAVAIARGDRLELFAVGRDTAQRTCSVCLGGSITAVAPAAQGFIVAAGQAVHHVFPEGRARRLAEVDAPVHALAAAGLSVYAAVGRAGRRDGHLLQIDAVGGGIVSERPLRTSRVRLGVDPTGAHVGVSDGATFRVLHERGDEPCDPREPPPSRPRPPDPCECSPGGDDGPGSTPAGQPPEDGPRRPRRDPCEPGQSGLPTPDGGAVVGDGSGVTHYPPGLAYPFDPCRLQLFFEVAQLHAIGPHYVAADREGRRVAILEAGDLRLVKERQFRRGAVLLSHPAQPMLLVFNRASGAWEREFASAWVQAPLDIVPTLDPGSEAMTFVGMPAPMQTLMGGKTPTVGKLSILVLPVLEPAQTFTDADLPKLSAYLRRVAFDNVRPYYKENSFGRLEDLVFEMFGVDAGPPGGPLRLTRTIDAYYHPPYVGAHVDLVKNVSGFPATIVLDGRERLTLDVQPLTGGRPACKLTLTFCAAILSKPQGNFPVEIRYDGTEKATIGLTRPDGTAKTLDLAFTPEVFTIANAGEVKGKLEKLEEYLEGVIRAAETAAGIASPLFARPVMRRLEGSGFGLLVTKLNHVATAGPKLEVTSLGGSPAAKDPLGFSGAHGGRFNVAAAGSWRLQEYLDLVAKVAQQEAGFNFTQLRLQEQAVIRTDVPGQKIVCSFYIALVDGGPGAMMNVVDPVETAELYTTATGVKNTDVTYDNRDTPRNGQDIFNDAFTAAAERMAAPGQHAQNKDSINAFFHRYQSVIVGHIGDALVDPSVAVSVQPSEAWTVGASTRRAGMRAVDGPATAVYLPFKDIQLQATWGFMFFGSETAKTFSDDPMFAVYCHELGHALGFGDLYKNSGYRDDVVYLEHWAMMCNHPGRPHHAGYHKWQAGWITEDRVFTIDPAPPSETLEREVLLVPIEYWPADNALVDKARSAFATPGMPVVQLVQLTLGGDADVFDLIEARQAGLLFGHNMAASPAVLVTNCVVWWDDTRYAFNDKYRRAVHLLNDPAKLTSAGHSFDLAKAAEFPAKGIVVEIVDRKTVDGIEVFRLKVKRENTAFIDLYFESSDPYYKNPDVWVDWTGDNGPGGKSGSTDPKDHRKDYPLGEPRDQGEKIYVPDSGEELHWIVGRLRNKGGEKALNVKLNYSICEPPGGGDKGNFVVKASYTLAEVLPGDKPVTAPGEWRVPAGFKGHTCVLVEVADYQIPRDSGASALASDDVWQANNKAQKNVDVIEPKPNSPYEPVEFDFSVNNSGKRPETAYLEPDGLPYGMRLTIAPRRRLIAAGETAIFRCRLELDDTVIDASCRSDRDFRILVWRLDGHTAVRWGGVQYKVKPRKRSRTDLSGDWDYTHIVELKGSVTPDPGTGSVRLRLAYADHHARWVTAPLQPGGSFSYTEKAPADTRTLFAVALFEGNRQWSESRSPERKITAPPVIH